MKAYEKAVKRHEKKRAVPFNISLFLSNTYTQTIYHTQTNTNRNTAKMHDILSLTRQSNEMLENPQYYLIWSFERTKTHLCIPHSRIKRKNIYFILDVFPLSSTRFVFYYYFGGARVKEIDFSPVHCTKLWCVTVWKLHADEKKSKGNQKKSCRAFFESELWSAPQKDRKRWKVATQKKLMWTFCVFALNSLAFSTYTNRNERCRSHTQCRNVTCLPVSALLSTVF